MRICRALLAAALLTSPAQISAQTPLAVGDRIRIGLSNKTAVIGTLTGFKTDSIVLALPTGDAQSYAWSDVRHVDISRGIGSHAVLGMVVGGFWGAGIGLLYESLAHADWDMGWSLQGGGREPEDHPDYGRAAMIGGAVGAVFGLIIGANKRSERWEKLPVQLVADGFRTGTRFRIGIAIPF